LAITGSKRLKGLPDDPSLAEVGIKGLDGIDLYTYYGLPGPAELALSASITSRTASEDWRRVG
jgi:tripartite-type tricarboxylate transporter receptor subunit TctC